MESDFVRIRHQIEEDCLIFIMTFCNGQNQFSPESVKWFNMALEYVKEEALKMARSNESIKRAALVTTGQDKYYSTGLMLSSPAVQADLPKFLAEYYLPLMGRFTSFPLISVAAINGHCFAGGMVMAAAHDFKVMRDDRGYMCMNEIELPSPVPAGMAALIRAKTSGANNLRDIFLCARRFSAKEALKAGLIDKVCSADECLKEAVGMAKKFARSIALMPVVESIKRDMYPEVMKLFEEPGSMGHVPLIIMKSRL